MSNSIMLGYDCLYWQNQGLMIPVYAPLNGHFIVVGGSGSGKSTAVLYWLYKARHFKTITPNFAQFEDCYDLIKSFYRDFQDTPEGGDGSIKILLIDEIAGLLAHFGMTKETKAKADEIRSILSSVLMLGRSRNCFVWLSMQRYSANIFPSSSGSADNFHVCVGLGRLTVDGRKGLFAGEHFDGEETLQFGQARGIVLVDGQPLRSLILPRVSKRIVLSKMQQN